jgi:hypothetical protein
MKRCILSCVALVWAGLAVAEDVQVASIPRAEIEKALPAEWRIASVVSADTVSGWKRLSGSKGVCLTISRGPYDHTLRPTKSGERVVYIPRLYLYVFPSDFEARNLNSLAVFRDGAVTQPESTPGANRSMLVLSQFTRVGKWYVFHNNPTFRDWKNPVDDVVASMRPAAERNGQSPLLGAQR